MRRYLPGIKLAALGWMLSCGTAFAQDCPVPPELWTQPRTGALVRAQMPLRPCVDGFQADPAARLTIHFGQGEEAALRADELRAWLMALALDGGRIGLKREPGASQPLKIELESTKGKEGER